MAQLETIIVRIAGLSIDHLDHANKSSLPGMMQMLELSERLGAYTDFLRDTLFEVVCRPEITKSQRNAALELKRAIHNCRSPKIGPRQIDEIKLLLNRQSGGILNLWLDDIAAFQMQKRIWDSEADRYFKEDVRKANCNALQDDGFSRAIKSTAWDVYCQLLPLKRDTDIGVLSNAERKLLTYIARAAWKTSPKSTFMYSGRLDLEAPDEGQGSRLELVSAYTTTHANPAIFNELQRLRPHEQNPETLVFRHKRAGSVNGSVTYPRSNFTAVNAGLWRSDRNSELMLGKAVTSVLFGIPREGQTTEAFFTALQAQGLTAPEAQAVIRIMLREGVIFLERFLGPDQLNFEMRLNELKAILAEDACATNNHWHNPGQISECLASVRNDFGITSALTRAGDARSEYGIAELRGKVFDSELRQCIGALELVLKDFVAVNPIYIMLAETFLREFDGDEYIDLSRLLEAFLRNYQSSVSNTANWSADDLIKSGHKVPVTAYFQVVSGSSDVRVVLNQAQTFSLSQSLRALPENKNDKENYLDKYRAWLEYLYHPAEPIEVPVCNSCNGMQSHPIITKSILDWGNETDSEDPVLEIEELIVSFDKSNRKFLLKNKNTHQHVSLVYLGGVVSQPAWGAGYLLTILNNPFVLNLPTIVSAESQLLAENPGNEGKVLHAPRIQRGKVVIRRAFWMVPSRIIEGLLKGSRSDGFLNLYKFCKANGINCQLFIYPSSGGDKIKFYTQKAFRKPQFLDIFNPALYSTLSRISEMSDYVILVEALPGKDEQWLQQVSDQRRVSELQIEFSLEM